MKNFKGFFAFPVLILFSMSIFAQQETFLLNDTSENGVVKIRRYNTSLHLHPALTEKELLNNTLKVGSSDELRLFSTQSDELGYIHNFYQQYYQGIKVEASTYATHILNGDVVTINGEFSKVGNPIVKPNLTETQALTAALQYVKADQYRWQIPAEETSLKLRKKDSSASYYPKGEVVICYDYMKTQSYRLAYKFYISGYLPASSSYVYVDALNGGIVAEQNMLYDVNVVTTVATKYSGSQTITTDQFLNGGTQEFRLQEVRGASNVSIQSFNSQRVNSTAQIDFIDLTNTWTASNNPNMDNAALDAHWASEKIYDYWSTVRNRNSYDGNGAALISFVHYNTPWETLNGVPQYHSGIDNSYWDGAQHFIILGDGYTQFNPLTSFDVCAHEFGHGFTEGAQPILFNAGGILINADGAHPEALALNEGTSDIWGAVIENWGTTGKQTWEIGEEIMKDGKPCLRSLQNPTTGGDPTGTAHNGYPSAYHDSYWDYGTAVTAAHTNSTVMSHWFYLLSQGGSGTNSLGNTYYVGGIGITKAASIVWRAEQNYYTANTQYADARTALMNSAIDLFCANSLEVSAVLNAWYAVGVGAQPAAGMSISGPASICNTSTYSVVNEPTGITSLVWSIDNTSLATINSTTGVATRIGDGPANVQANLIGTGGCATTISKAVTVGNPLTGSMNSGGVINPMNTVNNVPTGPTLVSFQWPNVTGINVHQSSTSPPVSQTGFIYYPSSSTFWFTLTSGQSITVSFTGTGCSGATSATRSFTVSGHPFIISPNPASSSINITSITPVNDDLKTESVQTAPTTQVSIMDVNGIVKKQQQFSSSTTNMQLNVGDLLPGVYFVRITKGTINDTQQLMINK